MDCMGQCIERFKGNSKFIHDLRNETIFNVLVEMYDTREAIDIITVQQKLKDSNKLDEVGGIAYLASLPDAVPSAANLSYYLDIIQDKFLLRSMIHTCTDVVGRIYEYEGEVATLMDEVEQAVLRIGESRVKSQSQPIKELVKGAITTIEDFHQRQGTFTGIGTGFIDFDKMTSGLHGGEMIVIAARPSQGKSSIAGNIVENVAIDQKLPVGFFSLEMTAASLALSMLCSRARVNLRNISSGFLAERDFSKIANASGKLANAPIYIDDSGSLSILELRAKARRMHLQHGIKLFVVDYLQLMHSNSKRAENRQQEVSEISRGIKALEKDLNVPIIAICQVNRGIEKDKNRKPRLADIRESGEIEADADVVGLLYKPKGDDDYDSAQEQDSIAVNLLIEKQRAGPTGEINLTFLKSYTRFESAAKITNSDVPTG